jgi:hypothetical protein
MTCAEAIGIAASLSVKRNIDPADVDAEELRKILKAHGAVLDLEGK